jgi:hypothetical protein
VGIQRPDGPYSVEMTAGPAWPGANENTYRDRADELRATLRSLTSTTEQWEQQRATLFNGDLVWSGEAATAAAAEVDKRTAAMHTLQDQLRAAATKADTTAAVIGAAKTQIAENVETAHKIIGQINNTPAATAEQKSAAIQQVVTTTHATNTAAVAAGAAQLGAAPPATPLNFRPTNTPPPQAPAPKKEEIPPPGSDPVKVKQWWDSHTVEEKRRLLAEHPDEIGNLRGIPEVDEQKPDGEQLGRSGANRIAIDRDFNRVADVIKAEGRVSEQAVMANPEKYGLTQKDIMRYSVAKKVREAEAYYRDKNIPAYVTTYNPEAFNGEGRAEIDLGNPDKASHVTYMVPGTGSSVTNRTLENKDALRLYDAELRRLPDWESPCVKVWVGYDAPNSLTDQRVANPELARQGAKLLAADVNGLAVTNPDAFVLVSGHSYGATTVADAAVHGMDADAVALLGCPGTDLAKSAADFNLPEGATLYVGSASTDPVTHIPALTAATPWGPGALGVDPAADGFGSTRFSAEVSDFPAGLPDPKGLIHSHTEYYKPGSDSLRSLELIATGNGEALESGGLTAPHRDRWHLPGGLLGPQDAAARLAEVDPTGAGPLLGTAGVLGSQVIADPEF